MTIDGAVDAESVVDAVAAAAADAVVADDDDAVAVAAAAAAELQRPLQPLLELAAAIAAAIDAAELNDAIDVTLS